MAAQAIERRIGLQNGSPRSPDFAHSKANGHTSEILLFSPEAQRLRRVERMGRATLGKVITEEGIYASTSKGEQGMFHALFTRDAAIMLMLMEAAMEEGFNVNGLFERGIRGFLYMGRWQGKVDNPETGEEQGEAIHEYRRRGFHHLVTQKIERGEKAWYYDPIERAVMNWDSADATALRQIVLGRLNQRYPGILEPYADEYRLGSEWILRNIREHGGRPAFRYNPQRKFEGLRRMGWKDSEHAHIHEDGREATGSITPVELPGATWAALKHSEEFFRDRDPSFAGRLRDQAEDLRWWFNSEQGLRVTDERTGVYYAEGIADSGLLSAVSADPALNFAFYFRDGDTLDCIIDPQYRSSVAARIMMDDMFDPHAGVHTYSNQTGFFDEEGNYYHRGPNTTWPMENGLIAHGFHAFGYSEEANALLEGTVERLDAFGSCIELFQREGEESYVPYRNPDPHFSQTSSVDQGFTAATAVYGANRLLWKAA